MCCLVAFAVARGGGWWEGRKRKMKGRRGDAGNWESPINDQGPEDDIIPTSNFKLSGSVCIADSFIGWSTLRNII